MINRKVNKDGYVQLKTEYLVKFIPNRYWPTIRSMLTGMERDQHGNHYPKVLVWDRHYEVGKKCYEYRLTDDYRLNRTRRVPIPANIKTKITVAFAELRKERQKVHNLLEGCLARLMFNADGIEEEIAGMRPKRKRRKQRHSSRWIVCALGSIG
jgi:hypothetical protein